MRSTSAMAASAPRRASVSVSAQICSSLTEAIAEKPKWNRGIVVLFCLVPSRRQSERLADSRLDPSRRERLETRAAAASDAPVGTLSVEIELQVEAPAVGQALHERQSRRQCTERRQARVRGVGLSGDETLRERRVEVKICRALGVIAEIRSQGPAIVQRLVPCEFHGIRIASKRVMQVAIGEIDGRIERGQVLIVASEPRENPAMIGPNIDLLVRVGVIAITGRIG